MDHSSALYQTSSIKKLEQQAFSRCHLSTEILMQRAGTAAFNWLRQHWPAARNIAVICGKGNNGGDGYVVAKLLHQAGLAVTVYSLQQGQLKDAAHKAMQACKNAGVKIQPFTGADFSSEIVVDALLGTGFHGEISSEYQIAITKINAMQLPVLAIDVPSGVNADTGYATTAVKATSTITFIGLKKGLFTGNGPAYLGEVYLDTLEIPAEIFSAVSADANLLDILEISKALPARPKDANKGKYGHVLIVGGDYGMAGAARMAAEAAARVGAGLTSVATHPEHLAVVSAMRPELMCHAVTKERDLSLLLSKATVIVVGPGLGQSVWSQEMLQGVLAASQPKVLDADALNLLAKKPARQEHWILTPHPGEAARLLNTTTEKIQSDRFLAAAELQQQYGGVCILKGVGTIVQSAEKVPGVCRAGNPGMASGGMGDVLSGVIGGLLAQRLSLDTAARVGVLIHSQAADRAALGGGERGMLAMDLMPFLQRLANP